MKNTDKTSALEAKTISACNPVKAHKSDHPDFAIQPGSGQESIWDFPLQPGMQADVSHIQVRYRKNIIADTRNSYRVVQKAHPPSFFIPASGINPEYLQRNHSGRNCEWMGYSSFYDFRTGGFLIENAALSYQAPHLPYLAIKNFFCFHPSRLDCYIDGEKVRTPIGSLHAGWVTSDTVGPYTGSLPTRSL